MEPGDENETNLTYLDLKIRIKKGMKDVEKEEKDILQLK